MAWAVRLYMVKAGVELFATALGSCAWDKARIFESLPGHFRFWVEQGAHGGVCTDVPRLHKGSAAATCAGWLQACTRRSVR